MFLPACSTTPVIEQRVEYVNPPKALRVLCAPPVTVPSKSVRDMRDNSLARKSAYETCAIRMANLLEWLDEAERIQAADAEK